MRIVLVLLLALFLSACNEGHYESVGAFKSTVTSWDVVGSLKETAEIQLMQKGFKCTQDYCYKDLEGFPCNQRLRVNLVTDKRNIVKGFSVWEINGYLPTQCL